MENTPSPPPPPLPPPQPIEHNTNTIEGGGNDESGAFSNIQKQENSRTDDTEDEHHNNEESDGNESDLSESEIDDYTLNDSFVKDIQEMDDNLSISGTKRKLCNLNECNDFKKLKPDDLLNNPDVIKVNIEKEPDNLIHMLDQSVSNLPKNVCDDVVGEIDENFDITEKLREMGEISVKPIDRSNNNPTTSSKSEINENEDASLEMMKMKNSSNSNTSSPDENDEKRKISNLRKNIREVMDDTQLDASTLAAQRQELERLARVQEQQKIIREVQRQIALERQSNKTQARVMSLLQGHTSLMKNSNADPSSNKITLPGSSGAVVVKVPTTDSKVRGIIYNDTSIKQIKTNLTPSVSIAPVKSPVVKKCETEVASLSSGSVDVDDDSTEHTDDEFKTMKKDVVTIVDSSDDDCILLSDDEEPEEDEDDPHNSGLHVNDAYNIPDENGNVVINIGHPESEPTIFVAPQIARVIKPHQIGGVRFLFDNVIESTERFDSSTGFGCILAHSMGLGKTLQLVCFCDIFLRHTNSKTVLCIMPINTLQNWLAEFNMWLPDDPEKSPLKTQGEVRPRNFRLFVLNDSHKTLNARSRVVLEWAREGGVLLIGYEMYRLLSLKKTKKKKKGKKHEIDDEIEQTEVQKQVWDDIHTALVKPGPDLVICDEGHRIKNSHASISVALKQIRSKRRIVLTGYPLQNNLLEYWCMVDFVRPNYLGTKAEFSNMFERPIQNGQCIDSTPQDIKLMRYRAHVLHSLLLGFVQRRSHAVLQTSLPQKEEYVLLIRMTPFQRKLYDVFMNEVVRTKAVPNPLKAFAVCCKIWNHPDVLYNFLKKREADLDLELEEAESVSGAAGTAKGGNKGKKYSPKKPGRKKLEINDEPIKPAATITPNANKSVLEDDKLNIKTEVNESCKTENTNDTKPELKELTNLNTPENSMSSYPPSNYSSGYGSQHSYDNYNPYGTPNNMYNDPYNSYCNTPSNSQQNYNSYNYPGYNQNDFWPGTNYYNQEYQNYPQGYDTNYYNYNPIYQPDQRPQNPNAEGEGNNNQCWNQNQSQSQEFDKSQTNTTEEDKSQSQEIVDMDTKEIKLEIRKEENITPKPVEEPNKTEEAVDEKSEEADKECVKVSSSPTKDDGIPYEWAVELMKNYIPDLVENSPKMEICFLILEESIRLGDRILIFSQSLLTLNLMEKFLQKTLIPGSETYWMRNVNYYRLDGSTPAIEREKLINEFNSNINIHLFLVSTRAGSLGINLVGANRVIVFDASWNPCHDTQAVCRVYRYGQKKPCFVYRLVMDNCLEKRIYDRQVNKQGMSDRVVDECNPDAHLSMKEVTNLCYDDQGDTEVKDFSESKDKFRDEIVQKVIEKHSKNLSKEPFQHESLLVDRKEKKLSSAEKRLAQRGYELEKQASAKPSYMYSSSIGTQYRAIRTPDGTIVHRPVASVRPMQADINTDRTSMTSMTRMPRPTRWIPAEVWQRQGMSAQEMTLPLDVVIPTSSAEKANIVLKAGQKVMVLKSAKGIYMQLESGKIIAIRTAFKMGQNTREKSVSPKTVTPCKSGTQISPVMSPISNNSTNIPSNLKNNSSITVVQTKPNLTTNKTSRIGINQPNRNIYNVKGGMQNRNIQLGSSGPYNMKQGKCAYGTLICKKDFDDNTNSSDGKVFDGEINDLSKDDDEENDADDEIEELKIGEDSNLIINNKTIIDSFAYTSIDKMNNNDIGLAIGKQKTIACNDTIVRGNPIEIGPDVISVHSKSNEIRHTIQSSGSNDSDDVIMVSSSQDFPPKPIDNYGQPLQYGLSYGNFPPYYHQSYSFVNSNTKSLNICSNNNNNNINNNNNNNNNVNNNNNLTSNNVNNTTNTPNPISSTNNNNENNINNNNGNNNNNSNSNNNNNNNSNNNNNTNQANQPKFYNYGQGNQSETNVSANPMQQVEKNPSMNPNSTLPMPVPNFNQTNAISRNIDNPVANTNVETNNSSANSNSNIVDSSNGGNNNNNNNNNNNSNNNNSNNNSNNMTGPGNHPNPSLNPHGPSNQNPVQNTDSLTMNPNQAQSGNPQNVGNPQTTMTSLQHQQIVNNNNNSNSNGNGNESGGVNRNSMQSQNMQQGHSGHTHNPQYHGHGVPNQNPHSHSNQTSHSNQASHNHSQNFHINNQHLANHSNNMNPQNMDPNNDQPINPTNINPQSQSSSHTINTITAQNSNMSTLQQSNISQNFGMEHGPNSFQSQNTFNPQNNLQSQQMLQQLNSMQAQNQMQPQNNTKNPNSIQTQNHMHLQSVLHSQPMQGHSSTSMASQNPSHLQNMMNPNDSNQSQNISQQNIVPPNQTNSQNISQMQGQHSQSIPSQLPTSQSSNINNHNMQATLHSIQMSANQSHMGMPPHHFANIPYSNAHTHMIRINSPSAMRSQNSLFQSVQSTSNDPNQSHGFQPNPENQNSLPPNVSTQNNQSIGMSSTQPNVSMPHTPTSSVYNTTYNNSHSTQSHSYQPQYSSQSMMQQQQQQQQSQNIPQSQSSPNISIQSQANTQLQEQKPIQTQANTSNQSQSVQQINPSQSPVNSKNTSHNLPPHSQTQPIQQFLQSINSPYHQSQSSQSQLMPGQMKLPTQNYQNQTNIPINSQIPSPAVQQVQSRSQSRNDSPVRMPSPVQISSPSLHQQNPPQVSTSQIHSQNSSSMKFSHNPYHIHPQQPMMAQQNHPSPQIPSSQSLATVEQSSQGPIPSSIAISSNTNTSQSMPNQPPSSPMSTNPTNSIQGTNSSNLPPHQIPFQMYPQFPPYPPLHSQISYIQNQFPPYQRQIRTPPQSVLPTSSQPYFSARNVGSERLFPAPNTTMSQPNNSHSFIKTSNVNASQSMTNPLYNTPPVSLTSTYSGNISNLYTSTTAIAPTQPISQSLTYTSSMIGITTQCEVNSSSNSNITTSAPTGSQSHSVSNITTVTQSNTTPINQLNSRNNFPSYPPSLQKQFMSNNNDQPSIPPYPISQNQITHSVTSMTNNLPSNSMSLPYPQSQIPQSLYNTSSSPTILQNKAVMSSNTSGPNVGYDEEDSQPPREKVNYKTKSNSRSNILSDPYPISSSASSLPNQYPPMQPNIYQSENNQINQTSQPSSVSNISSTLSSTSSPSSSSSSSKTTKTSLKNYRHNKSTNRNNIPSNELVDSQIINETTSSPVTSIQSPQLHPSYLPHQNISNFPPNKYPTLYEQVPPQNIRNQNQLKAMNVTPPSQMPNISYPPYHPLQGQPQPPPPQGALQVPSPSTNQPISKIESSLSFLEKTASSINEEKNGFQASLSSITRSYSPSPNQTPYNDMIMKPAAVVNTTTKTKRQNTKASTKKEKKMKQSNINTNLMEPQPQKCKTPNMQSVPSPYSLSGINARQTPPVSPFINQINERSGLTNTPPVSTALYAGPGGIPYGYNTIPSTIPSPFTTVNDPSNSPAQHYTSAYSGNFLNQYPAVSQIQQNLPAQSSPAISSTSSSSFSSSSINTQTSNTLTSTSIGNSLTSTAVTITTTSTVPSVQSVSSISTTVSLLTNTTSSVTTTTTQSVQSLDQNIPTPSISGSAFHRPDLPSPYGNPYFSQVPEPMSGVPPYMPPGSGFPTGSVPYTGAATIPPPNPYQPYNTAQFAQPLTQPISGAPSYPPYGYSTNPYGAPQYPPPPATYPPLSAGNIPTYDQRYSSSVPSSEQYSPYSTSYTFPPYAPQPGQWQ